jgi:hypothetical protein
VMATPRIEVVEVIPRKSIPNRRPTHCRELRCLVLAASFLPPLSARRPLQSPYLILFHGLDLRFVMVNSCKVISHRE